MEQVSPGGTQRPGRSVFRKLIGRSSAPEARTSAVDSVADNGGGGFRRAPAGLGQRPQQRQLPPRQQQLQQHSTMGTMRIPAANVEKRPSFGNNIDDMFNDVNDIDTTDLITEELDEPIPERQPPSVMDLRSMGRSISVGGIRHSPLGEEAAGQQRNYGSRIDDAAAAATAAAMRAGFLPMQNGHEQEAYSFAAQPWQQQEQMTQQQRPLADSGAGNRLAPRSSSAYRPDTADRHFQALDGPEQFQQRLPGSSFYDQGGLIQNGPATKFPAIAGDIRGSFTAAPPEPSPPASAAPSRIKVVVRKRPLNKKELARKEFDVIRIEQPDRLIVEEPKTKVDLTKYTETHDFEFDAVFDETVDNDTVYHETVGPIVPAIFEKTKATCFAYGQTGSGKTFTMQPLPLRAAGDMLSILSQPQRIADGFQLWISFFEIYGGKLFDLLHDRNKLQMREDGKQQVCIVGLQEVRVSSIAEVQELIQRGNGARSTGSTGANEESSRSHAILQMAIKQQQAKAAAPQARSRRGRYSIGGPSASDLAKEAEPKLVGKFSFIDLAGSERGADTTDNDKQTRAEGAEINKSLLSLKECIRALGAEQNHIPFRGSKLTEVLRDSFTGKICTVMVSCISPGSMSVEHTLNTLRYTERVRFLPRAGSQNRAKKETAGSAAAPNDGARASAPADSVEMEARRLVGRRTVSITGASAFGSLKRSTDPAAATLAAASAAVQMMQQQQQPGGLPPRSRGLAMELPSRQTQGTQQGMSTGLNIAVRPSTANRDTTGPSFPSAPLTPRSFNSQAGQLNAWRGKTPDRPRSGAGSTGGASIAISVAGTGQLGFGQQGLESVGGLSLLPEQNAGYADASAPTAGGRQAIHPTWSAQNSPDLVAADAAGLAPTGLRLDPIVAGYRPVKSIELSEGPGAPSSAASVSAAVGPASPSAISKRPRGSPFSSVSGSSSGHNRLASSPLRTRPSSPIPRTDAGAPPAAPWPVSDTRLADPEPFDPMEGMVFRNWGAGPGPSAGGTMRGLSQKAKERLDAVTASEAASAAASAEAFSANGSNCDNWDKVQPHEELSINTARGASAPVSSHALTASGFRHVENPTTQLASAGQPDESSKGSAQLEDCAAEQPLEGKFSSTGSQGRGAAFPTSDSNAVRAGPAAPQAGTGATSDPHVAVAPIGGLGDEPVEIRESGSSTDLEKVDSRGSGGSKEEQVRAPRATAQASKARSTRLSGRRASTGAAAGAQGANGDAEPEAGSVARTSSASEGDGPGAPGSECEPAGPMSSGDAKEKAQPVAYRTRSSRAKKAAPASPSAPAGGAARRGRSGPALEAAKRKESSSDAGDASDSLDRKPQQQQSPRAASAPKSRVPRSSSTSGSSAAASDRSQVLPELHRSCLDDLKASLVEEMELLERAEQGECSLEDYAAALHSLLLRRVLSAEALMAQIPAQGGR